MTQGTRKGTRNFKGTYLTPEAAIEFTMNIGGPRSGLCWPKGKRTEFCVPKSQYDREPISKRMNQGLPRERVLAELSPGAGRITGNLKIVIYPQDGGTPFRYLSGFSGVLQNASLNGRWNSRNAYLNGRINAATQTGGATIRNPKSKVIGTLQGENAKGNIEVTIPTDQGRKTYKLSFDLNSIAGDDGGTVGILGTTASRASQSGGKANAVDVLRQTVEKEELDQQADDRRQAYENEFGQTMSDTEAGKTTPTPADTFLKMAVPTAALVGAGALVYNVVKKK